MERKLNKIEKSDLKDKKLSKHKDLLLTSTSSIKS